MSDNSICPHHERLVKDVDAVNAAINGNGKEGMKEKLIRMEEQFKRVTVGLKLNNWLTGLMATALVSGLVKILFFMR